MENNTQLTLPELLTEHRQEILELCHQKLVEVVGLRGSPYPVEQGLALLYEQLVEVLQLSLADDSPQTRKKFVSDTITVGASRRHAQEAYRQGHTVSQLVQGYGSICQGITEYAHNVDSKITAAEFSQLNLCLDVAIAQAVSEFELMRSTNTQRAEAIRVGTLAHELRNALASAILAHELMKSGVVGASGATSDILANALSSMKTILDKTVAEVRINGEVEIERSTHLVLSIVSEVESSFLPEARVKKMVLRVACDPALQVRADRHLLTSAISNLVQNAIKFSSEGSIIRVRAFRTEEGAVIEVEDQCGGLKGADTAAWFAPYAQGTSDKSGLGLGLAIAKRAVELNGGTLTVSDLPDKGCVFTIHMPAA